MHTMTSGGSFRPNHDTSTDRHIVGSALARMPWPGLLTKKDLRHLVAEMVD